ncbi:MAG: type I methionyl aminopeptidase [Bacteroidota bacterium]|nr:type I methionyl aminopeptidase [Bacteroidota bacterium]MDX5429569.1 type I methionyl aminopeptidase [Bacteroidota bacterium]MDX5468356.1 type I methionyl aminopeptidase [Bacteroidota bacterium]
MAIIIKTPEQIEGIRKSSVLAAQTLKYLEQFVQPGITTEYIDKKCEEFVRDHGAKAATKGYNGFPASCCTSPNDVICHGIPGKYELRDGDILNIDVTTILDGYFGDTCKMYEVGTVSDYAKKLMAVTKECLYVGIKECYPGNYLGNIGYEINKLASSHGYSTVYEFCGHGVGLRFHEEPEVSHIAQKNTGPVLKAGMIFTIEPMINAGKARAKIDRKDGWTARTIDGKLSAQYEHTILVTDTKPEALTDIDGEFVF